eukprot:jgi/Mesvir1/5446/Mv15503-RA.1
MSQYDLTYQIGPYLDRHLVFPLLEFLQVQKIYPEEGILKAKIELLQKTNMVDYAMDIHKNLYNTEEVPTAMTERRKVVVENLKRLQLASDPLVQFLSNPNYVKLLRADKAWNLQFLQEQCQIRSDQIEALYHFAKFQFDCGNYSAAAEFLYHYRTLCTNAERSFSALWGKFASEILMQNWDTALEDMTRLKETIDSKNFSSPLNQLQQRTWLIHWSLFVFFNHENGRNLIIDTFFQERYMNAIQTNAPHILRYLATAVIVNKRRRGVLKDLVRVLQQEAGSYRDPITEFLECLFVHYDFEGAQLKLRECEEVLANDFFLVACRDEFIENARLFIFESYCRIHQCIDTRMLADKLNMDQESAERWIVNLIRNARLDAKIDSQAGTVIMGIQHPSVYEQIIEKTKGLAFRTYALSNNLLASAQAV